LDCVWQLTQQFPTAFEFSDKLLLIIMHHLHSGLYGTFLCNSPAEAKRQRVRNLTASLWTEIKNRLANDEFRNGNFSALTSNISRVLVPSYSNKRLSLWTDYYLRWIPDTYVTHIPFHRTTSSTDGGWDQNLTNNSDINKSRTFSQQNRERRSASGDETNENENAVTNKKRLDIHYSSEDLFLGSGRNQDKVNTKPVQKNKDLQSIVENLKRENLLIQKQNSQLIEKYRKLKKKLKAKNINLTDSDSDNETDVVSTVTPPKQSPLLPKNFQPIPSLSITKEKGSEAFPGIPLYTEGFGPGKSGGPSSPGRRQTGPNLKSKKESQSK